jgi:hypothetical protein
MRWLILLWVLVGCGSVESMDEGAGGAGGATGAAGATEGRGGSVGSAGAAAGAAGSSSGPGGSSGPAGAGGHAVGLPSCTEYPEANGNSIMRVEGCGLGLVFIDPVRGVLPCATCKRVGSGYTAGCIVEPGARRNTESFYCAVEDGGSFCEQSVPAPAGCHAQ